MKTMKTMNAIGRGAVGLAMWAAAAASQAAPASAESVRTLMDITKTRSMVDSMAGSIEASIRQGAMAGFAQRSGGKPMTAAQQASLDRMVARMAGIVRSSLRWEDLEPEYMKIYVETFDQDEIDGMIAFYRTPTGRALITKMPVVLQRSMAFSQARMQALMPKIMSMMDDELKTMK